MWPIWPLAMLINTTEQAYEEVERIFRTILPERGLTVREEQIALCHAMLDSLLHNTVCLCDAGVGIGKTYAYLVACILARKYSLRFRQPLVISTSSVALQEAIIREYLPFLSNVLLSGGIINEPLSAYLRKGKERFVCDERLAKRLKAVTGTKKNAEQLAALRSLMLRYDLDSAWIAGCVLAVLQTFVLLLCSRIPPADQKELLNRHLDLNIPFPNCITRNIGRTLKKQVTFLAADGDGIAVPLTASFGSGGLTAADNFVDYKVSTMLAESIPL